MADIGLQEMTGDQCGALYRVNWLGFLTDRSIRREQVKIEDRSLQVRRCT